MKILIKYLLIGVGFALTSIITWFCLAYDFRGEKVLIPYNYSGTCIIFYDVDNGEEKKIENYFGKVILKIPPSGVLAVNFQDAISRKTPLQNREYYLYDTKTGNILSKLTHKYFDVKTKKQLIATSIAVFSSDKIAPIRFESFRLFKYNEPKFINKKINLENTFITKKIVFE